MVRGLIARLREWVAVEDAEERIEGSGDAITSPQHRRSPEAERELDRLEELSDEHQRDDS
ncbi:hypothetical protein [Natronorubrum sp. FCH18a]|uniref:hypothetical protein n=1 Tax=Natronorubrum sp. FCH18a TaxID=3447018 RepID=UPI003F516221